MWDYVTFIYIYIYIVVLNLTMALEMIRNLQLRLPARIIFFTNEFVFHVVIIYISVYQT